MNFATLSPEVTSERLHHGPGAKSLAEAAAAWDRLAVRLCTAAADCWAVTSRLTSGETSVIPTAASAAAYVDWLYAAAAHAERAATQAAAAVRAHEAALAATVPPSVIEANLARRTSLATANCLGQSSATIAELEAEYGLMWAQDAEAMYAYARASADATPLTPFTLPPPVFGRVNDDRSWRLKSAPELVSYGRRVMTTIPAALRALSLSPLASFDMVLSPVTSPLSRLGSLSAPSGAAISHLSSLNKAAALMRLFPGPGQPRAATIAAKVGRARSIGRLSVPWLWSAKATALPAYRGTVA